MTALPLSSESTSNFLEATILVVDDDPELRRAVRRTLERAGHGVLEASSLAQARIALQNAAVDLVVLDLALPDGSGLQLLSELGRTKANSVGVIMLTGSGERAEMHASLRGGAAAYIRKPVDPMTLEAQVDATLLRVMADHACSAERSLLETSLHWVRAQLDELPRSIAERLCSAWDLRHVETGAHVRRIGLYTEALARTLGFAKDDAELLGGAGMLHDIGKIVIPDAILTKPGKLTTEEFEIMKLHPAEGAKLLEGSGSSFMDLATTVALRHHERWDGSGYPGRLKAEECPYEARIVAVADVYDALGQVRCYKPGWTEQAILDYFHEQSGKLFDPAIVSALFDTLGALRQIARSFPELPAVPRPSVDPSTAR